LENDDMTCMFMQQYRGKFSFKYVDITFWLW